MKNQKCEFNIKTDTALTFLESIETCNEFRNLINQLEGLNVVLDFCIHYSDYFNATGSNKKETHKLIHIEKCYYDDEDVLDLANGNSFYVKRETASVDLHSYPRLFNIFLTIYHEHISSIIYDLHDTGVSFFVSNIEKEQLDFDDMQIEIVDKFD